MMTCNRAGCGGAIEDGYCARCGLAPLAGATPAANGQLAGSRQPSGAFGAVASGRSVAASVSGRALPAAVSQRTGVYTTTSGRSARSVRTTRSGSSSRGSMRQALGGGFVSRPTAAPRDPLAMLTPGEVPERKRHCSSCGVKLNRDKGFCPKCGQEYSFTPSLRPGDVVAGKYEVKGTIAFGGLGWIYLALDTVLSRWVVLKGLLNAKDPAMIEQAVKEREFLAAVKHPNLVDIYDFVTHGRDGFIVMEHINGETLMSIRRQNGGPLTALEAIPYILDILPAFGYLDDAGLVYCDFKPENVMVEADTVKLIDMGAVRRAEDFDSDVFGSRGYAAPEANDAPSHRSDLYTVGRALAVLVADFDFQGEFEHALPARSAIPAFDNHESLYRWLDKATRVDPNRRFQSASEMAEQLLGVYREVAAGGLDFGRIRSSYFDRDDERPASAAALPGPTAGNLPHCRPDADDPAAAIINGAIALADPKACRDLYEWALTAHPDSSAILLRLTATLSDLGEYAEAEAKLNQAERAAPDDWRVTWYRARLQLAAGHGDLAIEFFRQVYAELPGELAPQLGIAYAAEVSRRPDLAATYYDRVSRCDPTATAASFGLARRLAEKPDRAAAADAYARVSPASGQFARAQVEQARVLLATGAGTTDWNELRRAADALALAGKTYRGLDLHELEASAYGRAVELLDKQRASGGAAERPAELLGVPVEARALRLGAEAAYRACAKLAPSRQQRIAFVDLANQIRPRTWV